jgi:hypothetical protein
MAEHGIVILIELAMVFGGALAFGWWQLRDLRRERLRREEAARRAASATTAPAPIQRGEAR